MNNDCRIPAARNEPPQPQRGLTREQRGRCATAHTGYGPVCGAVARRCAAEAVHSSLVWFLEATLMYSKWTQGIEKVRRQIVVVNAP